MISKKKIIIIAVGVAIIPVIIIVSVFAIYFIDIHLYRNSYHDIQLSEVMRIENPQIVHHLDIPYWYSYEKPESIKFIENKYNVSFGTIDNENEMLVISYGAELLSFDYNSREDSFRTRGHYIGFPVFGEFEPYTAYVYKTDKIPLFSAEVGGFSYDYMGMYRS